MLLTDQLSDADCPDQQSLSLKDLCLNLFLQMDADYDPSRQTVSKKKKKKERKMMKEEDLPQMGKKKKKSHFAEVITKNKPVFDPRKCR